MTTIEDVIAHNKDMIDHMEDQLKSLVSGQVETFDVSSSGERINTTSRNIEETRERIERLKRVVAAYERSMT